MAPDVEAAFARFEPETREALLAVRSLVFEAADDVDAGPLTETLKWGEPAYLTEATKSGTTIRLGTPKGMEDRCALFVHCQTSLVAEFREVIDDPAIGFEGNRAVIFPTTRPLPEDALRHCIAQALTYKRR